MMEQQGLTLLWLLLPLAAASGWWIARRTAGRNGAGGRSPVLPEYIRGLNYVLNEQPDKAIEVFIKMLEVDSETVETHLALGSLFRRRGEVDRAIRVHQNLIARTTLSREQRTLALSELGTDYMRSGLLDRAEGLFKELVDMGAHMHLSLRQLLEIYQQENDWQNAIATARRLEGSAKEDLKSMIAQFYCELAVEQLAAKKDADAAELVGRALQIDPDCVRGSLLEADMRRAAGDIAAAITSYQRTELQDPEYLPEVIGSLCRCYRDLGRLEEFMTYLHGVVERHASITSSLLLTDLIAEVHGEDEAIRFISGELRKRPTVRGVNRLIEYAMRKSSGETRDNLATIRELTERWIADRPVYKCNQCGFNARLLHWKCPSCRSWNTVKPVHGLEGE